MRSPLRHLRKLSWAARLGLLLVVLYLMVAVLAPHIAPYGETQVVGTAFAPWTETSWLGTDNLGRDMLSRLIYGARNMIFLALAINILSFVLGGGLGILAALQGGWVDQIIGRVTDAIMGVPQLILALLLIAIIGNSVPILIGIIVVLDGTRVLRLSRAVAMNVVATDYVEAARLRGEGNWWCLWSEVLPNIRTPLMAEFGIRFCYVFLFISGLSFLGIGLQPPGADWGSMVRESSVLITFGDFTPLLPAAAIAVLTISVNFIVDWLIHNNAKARL
ncbi:peptide/nickel transport system permease protein [Rhodoligotrophos appendicifer]|uniref:ABC transporter permease n=1 Tax=Rhodoligotrophos appendicifer TaxID=987056 RepID=UPI00118562E3|nr:ABC transporter permease [Rhodoligotrophos appendicifer]